MNEKNLNHKKDEILKRNKNEIVFYRVGKQRLKSNRKFYTFDNSIHSYKYPSLEE